MRSFIPQEGGLSNLISSRHLFRIVSVAAMIVGAGFLVNSPGCKAPVVGPDRKDPRNYEWSVQEIYDPGFQVIATDIWGTSSSNVYVTFLSGSVRTYKLFHFDGSNWKQIDISGFGSSQVGFDLFAIDGSSASDVWAVGSQSYISQNPPPNFLDSSLVIHFNGSSWSAISVDPRTSGLRTLSIGSSLDVWFGGTDPLLYHFDGISITPDSLDLILAGEKGHSLTFHTILNQGGDIYAGLNDFATGYFHFLNYRAGKWWELDSQFSTQTSLWMSPEGRLYGTFYGYGVYLWEGKAPWTSVYANPSASASIFGSSDRNVFVAGAKGTLFHFNGADWYQFKNIENPSVDLSRIWTDGNQVFVIGDDGFKSYIYRGK